MVYSVSWRYCYSIQTTDINKIMQRMKIKNKKNTKLSSKSLTEGSLRNHSVRKGERSLKSCSVFVRVKQRWWVGHSKAYRVTDKKQNKNKSTTSNSMRKTWEFNYFDRNVHEGEKTLRIFDKSVTRASMMFIFTKKCSNQHIVGSEIMVRILELLSYSDSR